MSIEEDLRRMLADERLREAAAHIDATRDMLGLRETRALSQILKNQVSEEERDSFNFTLAALALVMAQYSLAAYLHRQRPDLIAKDPKAKQIANIDPSESEFRIAVYAQGLGTYLPETAYDAVVNRISEQQDVFLQDRLLTIGELQFYGTSFFLTSAEFTSPNDHRINPGEVEKIRCSYIAQRAKISQEKFLRAIALPNELRAAVSLAPLK